MNLIEQDWHVDAQPILAECLEIRRRVMPEGHWLLRDIQSLLCETLAKQSKFIDAEALFVESAEQIQTPEVAATRRGEAVQHVVDLYTAWHAAEPSTAMRPRPRCGVVGLKKQNDRY